MNATTATPTNETKRLQLGIVSNRRLRVNKRAEPRSWESALEALGGDLDAFYAIRLGALPVDEHLYVPSGRAFWSIRRVA